MGPPVAIDIPTNGPAQPVARPGTDREPGRGKSVERKTSDRRGLWSTRILWAPVLLGVAAGLYVTRRSR